MGLQLPPISLEKKLGAIVSWVLNKVLTSDDAQNLPVSCQILEDMMYYTNKFHFQTNQIVNQMSDSPKKQEQKRDMKRIKQDGISILELCLPPP